MTDTLRERVAKVIYEAKRMRLLEAFGDTAGWPEWEALKPTLKEIQMEECDPYIALIRNETLEEAARELDGWKDMYGDAAARAIRALKDKPIS